VPERRHRLGEARRPHQILFKDQYSHPVNLKGTL
jgi:hypothetical protein